MANLDTYMHLIPVLAGLQAALLQPVVTTKSSSSPSVAGSVSTSSSGNSAIAPPTSLALAGWFCGEIVNKVNKNEGGCGYHLQQLLRCMEVFPEGSNLLVLGLLLAGFLQLRLGDASGGKLHGGHDRDRGVC